MQLTVVQIFRSSVVVVAKHDGARISFGLLRDVGCVPCDDLFGADLPDCSLARCLDGGREDDVVASSAGVGGDSDRQCGHRGNEGKGGEERGEELHRGSGVKERERDATSQVRCGGKGSENEEEWDGMVSLWKARLRSFYGWKETLRSVYHI